MNTEINNMVILNNELSDEAFKIYCILSMLTREENDYGFVSIHTLAEISGKTPETAQTLIKELIDKELVGWDAKKLLECSKWLNTPGTFYMCRNLEHYVMDYDSQFGYFTVIDGVMGIVMFPEAYSLYRCFAMLAGDSNQVHATMREITKLFGKKAKDTRKWLKVLIDKGIIETVAPDTYIVHDYYRDNLEE